jgi:NADH-quinone oxidoreductase subunit L
MLNMGGLRKKMPVTFLTFLIGGFALAGFPFITAGFWSKDEILADAWHNGFWLVFLVLALAALLTAFYTMRQITLTFFGEPRTDAASHASETPWTMLIPLGILAVFAIGAGWAGIPEGFLGLNPLPNWFHEFVGGTLLEHPEAVPFSFIPLLTSIVVSLGGLFLGWIIYRNFRAGQTDPLLKTAPGVHRVLSNKYYLDELYNFLFVRPAYWFAEQFSYLFLDRRVIDGFLHAIASSVSVIGTFFRNWIDRKIINRSGDLVGEGVNRFGRWFRFIQTGRIQQYMIVALLILAVSSILLYYLVLAPGALSMVAR